jgi:glycine/sarcosine N-methyltransferase
VKDIYEGFAERYDWMAGKNPAREQFFKQLFIKNKVSNILDCACGTGRDLIMFHEMGFKVYGSDLSDAMLAQASKNIAEAHVEIPIRKIDYCELPSYFDIEFDAVVCLSNAINEPLEDNETLRALHSMKSVLRAGGILVFDQGQTDASIQHPSRFEPVINNRDCTRFFVIDYAGAIQTVNIFDFIHTKDESDFNYTEVRIRIRLQDSWNKILNDVGFKKIEFFGDWNSTPYDKESSRRLIAVAIKQNP